jgi:hypothetical protein
MVSIYGVPDEIIIAILSNLLSIKNINSWSTVCKKWRAIWNQGILFKSIEKELLPKIFIAMCQKNSLLNLGKICPLIDERIKLSQTYVSFKSGSLELAELLLLNTDRKIIGVNDCISLTLSNNCDPRKLRLILRYFPSDDSRNIAFINKLLKTMENNESRNNAIIVLMRGLTKFHKNFVDLLYIHGLSDIALEYVVRHQSEVFSFCKFKGRREMICKKRIPIIRNKILF